MKRVLIGAFVALLLEAGLAPASDAAEIPPTAECVSASRTLFKTYFKEISGDRSQDEEDVAERKLVKNLAAADCISEAEPLLVKTAPKPYSAECRAGAITSEKFWRPGTRKLRAIERAGNRFDRSIGKRVKVLRKKINRLTRKGADERRIARLGARRFHLIVRRVRRKVTDFEKMDRTAARQAFASTLIVYELLSRRCLPFDFDLDDLKGEGPAFRTVRRNEPLIYAGLFHIVLKYLDVEIERATLDEAKNVGEASGDQYDVPIRTFLGMGTSE